MPSLDLFGLAILDYQTNNKPENLITETNITEPDELEVSWLFRSYAQMPKLEKKALELSRGKILDVGCGSGIHSLYLKDKGFDVLPIDISRNAIEACHLRGLENAEVNDIFNMAGNFDTILLLMNGTGICGKMSRLGEFLQKLKSLLNENGQILIDSSDLIYMFDEDEDGGHWIPSEGYYGELDYRVSYKGQTEPWFHWLYLDYNTLQNAAWANGLEAELIVEGEHYDYLAKLTLESQK